VSNDREDVSKLNYTTMCVKESLRMYTTVAYPSKVLAKDFVMNGQRIPKGI